MPRYLLISLTFCSKACRIRYALVCAAIAIIQHQFLIEIFHISRYIRCLVDKVDRHSLILEALKEKIHLIVGAALEGLVISWHILLSALAHLSIERKLISYRSTHAFLEVCGSEGGRVGHS
jgi:hypothetical protein